MVIIVCKVIFCCVVLIVRVRSVDSGEVECGPVSVGHAPPPAGQGGCQGVAQGGADSAVSADGCG